MKKNAPTIEKDHVYEVYDIIAAHFSNTRYKAWPLVENFLFDLPVGAVVADVGCGNGKYLGVNPNLHMIGSDRSIRFVEICKEKGHECMAADNLHLPYRDSSFDSAISIAVIHHFAAEERRLRSLQELIRIIKPGGKLLVTVWALQQDWKGKNYNEQDVMIPWHFREDFKKKTEKKKRTRKYNNTTKQNNNNPNYNKNKEVQDDKSESVDDSTVEGTLENLSIQETEQKNGENNNSGASVEVKSGGEYDVYQRYYHLFKEGELETLITQIPNTKVLSAELDHDNWYLIVQKIG